MSTKVSKTAIGAFVLGAIALLVAGVLVLGAGKFLTKEFTYITYFDGSVKGLNVGSPVTFRGVKIGAVTNISIVADPTSNARLKIPVIFTLEPEKFKGTRAEFHRDPKAIEIAVKQFSLRTQLQLQSFVTGQLVVSLDFFPGTPANFVGLTKEYPEIPSVPMPLEQLQKTIEELPLKQIADNLNATIIEVRRIASSIDAQQIVQTLEAGIHDIQTLVRHVNAKIDPLVENITKTSTTAEATLAETRETVVVAREKMKELVTSTEKTLETARSALKQSEQTLQAYSGDSRLMVEFNKTLRELNATARSLRQPLRLSRTSPGVPHSGQGRRQRRVR